MQRLPHPNHAKTTRRWALLLLAATLAMFACTALLSDRSGTSLRDLLLVATTILLGSLGLAVAILRAFLCRCATCGRLLAKQEKVDTEEASRKFVCLHCGVVWDSQVKLST